MKQVSIQDSPEWFLRPAWEFFPQISHPRPSMP
jgi:hypothetical protein